VPVGGLGMLGRGLANVGIFLLTLTCYRGIITRWVRAGSSPEDVGFQGLSRGSIANIFLGWLTSSGNQIMKDRR